MSRHIDADKLAYMVVCNGDADFINKVTKLMVEAPSIDIVFCKECKHHFYDEFNDCKMCHIHEYGEIWEDDDYCSYGEREGE